MLATAAVVTLAFFPVYLLLRAPYWRLPLHIDTGFYVSNHTIATGRIDFSQGWNAHFAGCSKCIPELFYSLIYLFHDGRKPSGGTAYRCKYKYTSRIYASAYNYLTAIALGILACQLAGGDPRFYYSALAVFSLLSSEPQHGVYFECGELFGVLGNVVAFTLLTAGLQHQSAVCVGLAAFVWATDAYFVKLSSAIAFVIVFAAALLVYPSAWTAVLCGGALATVLYLLWVQANGRQPLTLLRALGQHETSYGQRAHWLVLVTRLGEKCRCLGRTISRQPLIPVLAVAGAVLAPPQQHLLWVYLFAVLVTYTVQAADCWYYQIPLLPPIALLAGGAVVMLATSGQLGVMLLLGAALLWLAHNTARAARMKTSQLNLWCWKGYRPTEEIRRNDDLEATAREVYSTVAGKSLLVYGPYNQAYALLGAGYSTPIVAPEFYMDDLSPDWQQTLSRQLVESPPTFILDTSNSFDADTTRRMLGLDYQLTHIFDSQFRLHRLHQVSAPQDGYQSARTYQPQSPSALVAEQRRAAPRVVVNGPQPGTHIVDMQASEPALTALLENLAQKGYRRIAIYGAGRFTIRHRHVYRRSKTPVVVVLDDRAARHGATFLDWPIHRPQDAAPFDLDAIIISTDRFTTPMLARARRLWTDRIDVFTIADGRTPAPNRTRHSAQLGHV